MVCADMDEGRQRVDNVEVVFPESNVVGAQASSAADSTGPATASSVAANSLTLAEKAISALGATQGLRGHNFPRVAAAAGTAAPDTSSQPQMYARTRKRSRNAGAQDLGDEDDSDQQEDPQEDDPAAAEMDEDESESIEAEPARGASQVDPHLL
jgi:hypothetical protein